MNRSWFVDILLNIGAIALMAFALVFYGGGLALWVRALWRLL